MSASASTRYTGAPSGGELAGLRVVEAALDVAPRDLPHVVGVDETEAVLGGDHDPVEDIDLGYLQHVLEGPDLRAGTAEHRRPAGRRLV